MKKNHFSKSCLLLSSLCVMGILSNPHQASAQETTNGETDYLVVIPSGYELSDKHQLDKNNVLICDKGDSTQEYKGEQEVSVKIQSANNFVLGSSEQEQEGKAGKYRLIDENKKEVTADGKNSSFILSKANPRQTLNAQLTKKASDKNEASDQLLFTYKNEATISLKKTNIHKKVDEACSEAELRDNIIGLTNSKGEDVLASDKAQVEITAKDASGNNVVLTDLTKVEGVYTITYSYKGVTSSLTLEVGDITPSIVGDDESTINFMGMAWSVLRGPSEMGEGNYLVAARRSIKKCTFNNNKKFFETNDRDQDGYLGSNVKQEIDKWYDANVKGTAYEQSVRPVVLPNPTLGDMIDLGVLKSNTKSGEVTNYWQSHDAKYRTRIDETNGVKQAFALSAADVSTGEKESQWGDTYCTPAALAWFKKYTDGGDIWLRSPGSIYNDATKIDVSISIRCASVTTSNGAVPSLVVHIQNDTSITLKDSNIVKGLDDTYGEAELRDNITGLTNSKGEDVLASDKSKVEITAKNASGNNVALSDLTKAVGTYTITYSYNNKTVETTLTVKDEASISLKASSINKEVGEAYGETELRENIVGLTNKIGEDTLAADRSKVEITAKDASGNNVTLSDLTKAAGTYTITYSYNNKTANLALTIEDVSASKPVMSEDGTTVNFMNMAWSVLRGPSDMGEGNYLIACDEVIERSAFNDNGRFFETDNRSEDGYLTSNVKKKIDAWYDANIKGTAYEQSVQPVVLPNPTLGDMIDLGVLKDSMTGSGHADFFYKSHDAKYRTRVDETNGVKQAFALSSADVSNGIRDGYNTKVSSEALIWGRKAGIREAAIWLRSPGIDYNRATDLEWLSVVGSSYVTKVESVVPSLVVHISNDTSITLKDSNIVKGLDDTYGESELRDNITGLTNSKGEDVLASDKSKVEITAKNASGNNVALSDLTKAVGTYTITYSYNNKTVETTLTVKDEASISLKASSINKEVGEAYGETELRENIVGLTNKIGEDTLAADRSKVEITAKDASGNNVTLSDLTKAAGTYTITYSYNNKTANLALTIEDVSASKPVMSEDGTTVNFMNMAWSVLRGPSDMGEGNYLIICQEKVKERTSFNNDDKFFETNDRNQDGYLRSNVKQELDKWYDTNVKGTKYEQSVRPVVLPNPTLGDMIDFGVYDSNTESYPVNEVNWWRSYVAKYRTRVDETNGVKQAFALSTADVSSGVRNDALTTKLTQEVLDWKQKFPFDSNYFVWLRSPGALYTHAGCINRTFDVVSSVSVNNKDSAIVPSLVVHIK